VALEAIACPTKKFGTPKEIFEQVYEHKQIEEEKNDRDILDQLAMAGNNSFGILFLDKHVLGERKED